MRSHILVLFLLALAAEQSMSQVAFGNMIGTSGVFDRFSFDASEIDMSRFQKYPHAADVLAKTTWLTLGMMKRALDNPGVAQTWNSLITPKMNRAASSLDVSEETKELLRLEPQQQLEEYMGLMKSFVERDNNSTEVVVFLEVEGGTASHGVKPTKAKFSTAHIVGLFVLLTVLGGAALMLQTRTTILSEPMERDMRTQAMTRKCSNLSPIGGIQVLNYPLKLFLCTWLRVAQFLATLLYVAACFSVLVLSVSLLLHKNWLAVIGIPLGVVCILYAVAALFWGAVFLFMVPFRFKSVTEYSGF